MIIDVYELTLSEAPIRAYNTVHGCYNNRERGIVDYSGMFGLLVAALRYCRVDNTRSLHPIKNSGLGNLKVDFSRDLVLPLRPLAIIPLNVVIFVPIAVSGEVQQACISPYNRVHTCADEGHICVV